MDHASRPATLTDFGELDRSGAVWRLRFVRQLAHSPERVWRALTEPAELEAWFPTTIDGERASGAPLTFRFRDGEAETMSGRMIACEPPRLLEFLWSTDTIRFELEPTEQGTRLTLWDTLDENGKAARDGAGWHVCLDGLLTLLDVGNAAGDRLITQWADVHPHYQQRFGPEASTIGPPEGHPATG